MLTPSVDEYKYYSNFSYRNRRLSTIEMERVVVQCYTALQLDPIDNSTICVERFRNELSRFIIY